MQSFEIISVDYHNSSGNPIAKVERDGKIIEIEFWDIQSQLIDVIDHTCSYICFGDDDDERQYAAIAIYTCDELEEIRDIETV